MGFPSDNPVRSSAPQELLVKRGEQAMEFHDEIVDFLAKAY